MAAEETPHPCEAMQKAIDFRSKPAVKARAMIETMAVLVHAFAVAGRKRTSGMGYD